MGFWKADFLEKGILGKRNAGKMGLGENCILFTGISGKWDGSILRKFGEMGYENTLDFGKLVFWEMRL